MLAWKSKVVNGESGLKLACNGNQLCGLETAGAQQGGTPKVFLWSCSAAECLLLSKPFAVLTPAPSPRDGLGGKSGEQATPVLLQAGTMVEPELRPTAGHRLGAQETLGISTLDPGHRPPTMPPGRLVSIRVLMLDDTEEVFDISGLCKAPLHSSTLALIVQETKKP
ncbi:hypothetical protein Z043_100026 [Scleropages formosus]|uniref:FERM domain-containing protein n=1 Tax=Scleropages formosus TaxID=113540 RepID=A0A0P7ZH27_SCLFO|nr:hypothetical protein Z043_100026 [Scleropages formosus]